jgi:hypothetical protein
MAVRGTVSRHRVFNFTDSKETSAAADRIESKSAAPRLPVFIGALNRGVT